MQEKAFQKHLIQTLGATQDSLCEALKITPQVLAAILAGDISVSHVVLQEDAAETVNAPERATAAILAHEERMQKLSREMYAILAGAIKPDEGVFDTKRLLADQEAFAAACEAIQQSKLEVEELLPFKERNANRQWVALETLMLRVDALAALVAEMAFICGIKAKIS